MTEQQAKELLEKYRLGLCTPEEEQAIIKWADSLGATPHAAWTDQEQAIFAGLLDKRVSALTGLPVSSKPATLVPFSRLVIRRRRMWWAAAASILLIGASIAIIISSNRRSHSGSTALVENISNDALPGHNGAILTLAGGKQVMLDSVSNGVVATQGATTIAVKDGQLLYHAENPTTEVLYNTMSTPRGRQYSLVLPDGTRVWLDAASSITYPAAFIGNNRAVKITGEAYFEVAKNKEKPFIVDIDGKSTVRVLGTHFNVNAYNDEPDTKVTLLEGSVKVKSEGPKVGKSGSNEIILKPGEQARLSEIRDSIRVIRDINIEQVLAWKNGIFQFNETDLQTVLKQLARWYDIEVVFEGAVPNETFIGELPRNAPLSQILRVLAKTQVHFRIEGKKLIVTK